MSRTFSPIEARLNRLLHPVSTESDLRVALGDQGAGHCQLGATIVLSSPILLDGSCHHDIDGGNLYSLTTTTGLVFSGNLDGLSLSNLEIDNPLEFIHSGIAYHNVTSEDGYITVAGRNPYSISVDKYLVGGISPGQTFSFTTLSGFSYYIDNVTTYSSVSATNLKIERAVVTNRGTPSLTQTTVYQLDEQPLNTCTLSLSGDDLVFTISGLDSLHVYHDLNLTLLRH